MDRNGMERAWRKGRMWMGREMRERENIRTPRVMRCALPNSIHTFTRACQYYHECTRTQGMHAPTRYMDTHYGCTHLWYGYTLWIHAPMVWIHIMDARTYAVWIHIMDTHYGSTHLRGMDTHYGYTLWIHAPMVWSDHLGRPVIAAVAFKRS